MRATSLRECVRHGLTSHYWHVNNKGPSGGYAWWRCSRCSNEPQGARDSRRPTPRPHNFAPRGGRTALRNVRDPAHVAAQQMVTSWYDECQVIDCPYADWGGTVLDGCHIVAPKDGGLAHTDNILAMCPSHHRLFDQGFKFDIWMLYGHDPVFA